ncbi:hypothetical protein ACIQBJ_21610 [Kitasatospora sp. NPDC088391]|uniref:hypothetical protein n=1 Tax=Kitasatospora sp. NPDC088391 TaxID=3364074 RepID=UPI0038113590
MSARAASGPYRTWVTVVCAAIPVLTLGILGMAPSVVLAVGRRRRADIVGAVVIGLMQLTLYIEMGLTPKDGQISNLVGVLILVPLWIGTPVHFLLMNQRRFWPAAEAAPAAYGYPAAAPQGWPTAAPAHPTAGYPATAPTAAYPTPAPAYPTPANPYLTPYQPAAPVPAPAAPAPGAPTPAPGQTGAAELRELGELLRRQAGDGQP